MKKTSVLLASTIIVLAIASHGAEAAPAAPVQSSGAGEASSNMEVFNGKSGRSSKACWASHKKCYSYIHSLCRRLLKNGLTGGNQGSCVSRKALRCDTLFDCK